MPQCVVCPFVRLCVELHTKNLRYTLDVNTVDSQDSLIRCLPPVQSGLCQRSCEIDRAISCCTSATAGRTPCQSYTKNKVTKVDSVRFIVDSEERDTKYDVFFGDDSEMPYCQCYDWSKYHWPCKHMLAVIQHTDTTWQTLCPTYRDSPFFTLDTDLLSVPATYDNAVIHSTATCDSETTVNSIPDAEDGNVASPVRSMSARCREVLRVLTDATYICSDPVGLQNLHTHLQNAAKELQTFLPQDSGLVLCDPPKRSRKNKKVRVRSQQKDMLTFNRQLKTAPRNEALVLKVLYCVSGLGDATQQQRSEYALTTACRTMRGRL